AEAPPAWPPPPEPAPVEPRPPQPPRQGPMRQPSADDIEEVPGRSRVGLVAAIVTVLLILGLGAAAYWQRDRIAALVNVVRGPAKQPTKDAGSSPSKIPDRIGQPSPGQTDQPASSTPAPSAAPVAAVAQRVVLYEEDPADAQGKRYVGSAIWRTETVTPGPGA